MLNLSDLGNGGLSEQDMALLALLLIMPIYRIIHFEECARSSDEYFYDIYILNLHGNCKKGEIAPDGSKDENVFDIQQGVAILLAIR